MKIKGVRSIGTSPLGLAVTKLQNNGAALPPPGRLESPKSQNRALLVAIIILSIALAVLGTFDVAQARNRQKEDHDLALRFYMNGFADGGDFMKDEFVKALAEQASPTSQGPIVELNGRKDF